MFAFLKINLYRKKFIIYIGVLLAVSVLFAAVLTYAVLSARITAINADARRAFDRVESDIRQRQNEVELYVQSIYNDHALLADMELFMRSNSEGYLSARLQSGGAGGAAPSIVESVQEFAIVNSQSIYRMISFHSPTVANVILFDASGSGVRFRVDNDDPLFSRDIREGVVFERTLAAPHRIGESIGTARFVLDSARCFAAVLQYNLPNTSLVDADGNLLTYENGVALPSAGLLSIIGSGQNQGEQGGIRYVVFTSPQYGYRFLAAYDTAYLLGAARGTLIAGYLGIAALFIVVMLLVSINMRHEAEFLTAMLDNINKMESGRFEPMDNKYGRKNEYGIIADALNDMGGKLDRHIRTEYLLKLRQREAEMVAMQHQVNPHFLYNTLEIIRSSATRAGAAEAADSIASLGKMYRSMVSGELEITMAQELEFLNAYLEIMEFRNRGTFYFQTEMDEAVRGMKTVKFWMQPIAENFFRHGYDRDSEYNLFVLSATAAGNGCVIELVNNGGKIDEERLALLNQSLSDEEAGQPGGSIGLKNVYARLKYYYGDDFRMRITNNDEAGITVRVEISREVPANV